MSARFKQKVTLEIEWDDQPGVTSPNTWNWTEILGETAGVVDFEPVEQIGTVPDDDEPDESGLVSGVKYLMQYKLPAQRIPRWALMTYLECKAIRRNGNIDFELTFSGRPQFGTTWLHKSWIVKLERVSDVNTPFVDRKEIPAPGVRTR